jgi:hypothetical protein
MGGGQLSLMRWLNHEPVVFVATAGDRPAVVLFSSVVRGLARVLYLRRRFLYENGGGWSDGSNGVRWPHTWCLAPLTSPWSFVSCS